MFPFLITIISELSPVEALFMDIAVVLIGKFIGKLFKSIFNLIFSRII